MKGKGINDVHFQRSRNEEGVMSKSMGEENGRFCVFYGSSVQK